MRILHILDHSLPMHSGYTFRTRAILKAQQELGWDVRGVTGLRHTENGPDVEAADGLNLSVNVQNDTRLGGSGVERGQSIWVYWSPEDSIVLTE